MKGADVGFSFDSREERERHRAYAKAKGLTLPALAKFALIQYESKYPLSEAQIAGRVRKRGRPVSKNLAVQPDLSGGQE